MWPSLAVCVASVISGASVLYKSRSADINNSPPDATSTQEHRPGMRVNFVLTSDSHGAVPNQDDDDNMLPHAKLLPSLTYVCFVGRTAGWMDGHPLWIWPFRSNSVQISHVTQCCIGMTFYNRQAYIDGSPL
jgi:hypothetical protein